MITDEAIARDEAIRRVPAAAREVTDPVERRAILELVAKAWRRTDVDTMVEHSPLVEVTIDGFDAAGELPPHPAGHPASATA